MNEDIIKELEEQIRNMDKVLEKPKVLFLLLEKLEFSIEIRKFLKSRNIYTVLDFIIQPQRFRSKMNYLGKDRIHEINSKIQKLDICDIGAIEAKIFEADIDLESRTRLYKEFLVKREEIIQKSQMLAWQKNKKYITELSNIKKNEEKSEDSVKRQLLPEQFKVIDMSRDDIEKLYIKLEKFGIASEVIELLKELGVIYVKDWLFADMSKRLQYRTLAGVYSRFIEEKIKELEIECLPEIQEVVRKIDLRNMQNTKKENTQKETMAEKYERESRNYMSELEQMERDKQNARTRRVFEAYKKKYDVPRDL